MQFFYKFLVHSLLTSSFLWTHSVAVICMGATSFFYRKKCFALQRKVKLAWTEWWNLETQIFEAKKNQIRKKIAHSVINLRIPQKWSLLVNFCCKNLLWNIAIESSILYPFVLKILRLLCLTDWGVYRLVSWILLVDQTHIPSYSYGAFYSGIVGDTYYSTHVFFNEWTFLSDVDLWFSW